MKCLIFCISAAMLMWCSGCVPVGSNPSIYNGRHDATVVFHPSDCNNLLSCLQESKDLSRKEYASYYKQVAFQVKKGEDADVLRYVCLSLHPYADCQQFKKGMTQFEKYIESHPDERTSLQGLHLLMKRIDREKVNYRAERNRLMEENRALAEKVEELQKQIEQLKNIENIIKNREL